MQFFDCEVVTGPFKGNVHMVPGATKGQALLAAQSLYPPKQRPMLTATIHRFEVGDKMPVLVKR